MLQRRGGEEVQEIQNTIVETAVDKHRKLERRTRAEEAIDGKFESSFDKQVRWELFHEIR